MQDTEEWDDLQELESQACGTLTQVLDKSAVSGCGGDAHDDDDGSVCYIDVIDDSPQPRKQQKKVVELDSSEDDEDMEFSILREKEKCVPPGSAKSMV